MRYATYANSSDTPALPVTLALSPLKTLIDDHTKNETDLLGRYNLSNAAPEYHTCLIYNPNIKTIKRVILFTNGFMATNREGEALAKHIVCQDATIVIVLFATPGFITLQPEEASALFRFDQQGRLIPETELLTFYRSLALCCAQNQIKLITHGTSFGAQLMLRVLLQIEHDHSAPLPARVNLHAPFLRPTFTTNYLVLAVSYLLHAQRLLANTGLPVGLFQALVALVVVVNREHHVRIDHSERGIGQHMLGDVPIDVLLTLRRVTQATSRHLSEHGLPTQLRARTHLVYDTQDPRLGGDITDFLNQIGVNASRRSCSRRGVHVIDELSRMPPLTLLNGHVLRNEQSDTTTLTALMSNLTC